MELALNLNSDGSLCRSCDRPNQMHQVVRKIFMDQKADSVEMSLQWVCVVQISQTWVTQLQLEMLAAPAQSALLVSRSASQVRSRCYASGPQFGVRVRL